MKKKLGLNKKKFFPVSEPIVTRKDIISVNKALKAGWISSEGPEVKKFEKNFSKYIGHKYAIAVSSGTAALEIAVKSLNLKKGDEIIIPKAAIDEKVKIQPEAELAVVIGKECKGATQANALDFVFAYTCGNDVSARDWQQNDLQWTRAKSSDTFGPIGPWMTTDLDPTNLQVICRVNGEEKQNQNTSDLLHPLVKIIEYVSAVVTLHVGDVIMTGTPGTPGDIFPGDIVEV